MGFNILKLARGRLWFAARSSAVKGLLLGFFIPLILSVVAGLLGLLLGTRMEADLGSRIITAVLLSVDLPGMLFLSSFITMLPGGDESLAMGFLLLATLPSCIFWALVGVTISGMIRMTKI